MKNTGFIIIFILMIVAIGIMAIFLCQMYTKITDYDIKIDYLNSQLKELEEKDNYIDESANAVYPTSNYIADTSNGITPDSDENEINENVEGDEINSLMGKWNTFRVYDVENDVTTENLKDVFGSSYLSFGSYLQLNPDGSFVDAIQPITSGETSTKGKYEVEENYNKSGDKVVILNYDDGTKKEFRVIYEDDENTPILYNFTAYNSMQYSLKMQ